MNPVARWLEANGGPAAKRKLVALCEEAGGRIRWQAIHMLAEGRSRTPRVETALLLERATGGEISARELLGLAPSIEAAE